LNSRDILCSRWSIKGVFMSIRNFFLSLLAAGMAVFLLLNFVFIWMYGKVSIFETNVWVLGGETAMMAVVCFFSVYCGIKELKKTSR